MPLVGRGRQAGEPLIGGGVTDNGLKVPLHGDLDPV